MLRLKWFEGVFAAQREAQTEQLDQRPLDLFDFETLVAKGRLRNWAARFLFRKILPLIFAILRNLFPVLRIGRLVIVSRYADVVEVLQNRSGIFPVVYSPEMQELGLGTQGVLGLEGDEHAALRETLMSHILKEDLANIGMWARDSATALLDASQGEIDVARDLIIRVATETCCRYFGITVNDPDAFAEWSMAVSMQLFADPTGDANTRKQARIGAIHLGALIDDAIDRVVRNNRGRRIPPVARDEHYAKSTLIDRLVTYENMKPGLIRSTIIGLATGFVPTNTLAAGNMLEELLANPSLHNEACVAARAVEAARAQSDSAQEVTSLRQLRFALLKAARINPALSPGIWRWCPDGGKILRGAGKRNKKIRPGSIVMVSILSALRDGRMPPEIANDPEKAAWLIFGSGPHDCAGAHIALTQITETFAALLAKPGLAPAPGKHGWMQRASAFPIRFDMTYDCATSEPALLVSAIRARVGVSVAKIEAALKKLGNPISPTIAAELDRFGCIDFLSLNVIEEGDGSDRPILLIEVNGDGSPRHVLHALAMAGGDALAKVLAGCTEDGLPPRDAEAASSLMLGGVLDLKQNPWGGAMGLHFDGLPGLKVTDIARQDLLANKVRELIDWRMRAPGESDGRAIDILLFVRRMLKQDTFYARRHAYSAEMARIDPALSRAVIRPSRKRLAIADWKNGGAVWRMLKAPSNRALVVGALMFSLICGVPCYLLALPHGAASWWQQLLALGAGLLGGAVTGSLLIALGFGALLLLVRLAEKKDKSDPRIAEYDHIQAIAALEDKPGYEQNHIIALMPMKKGLVRRFSFAFSMWWIRQAVSHWFRPGFVLTMGTIHKARWFVVPGTRQFVFNSNYDGSWESYLEDFVTRAHEGQSSAWSHGVGFPPTRFLVFDGASDGDRFKRWVRRQQRPSLCWYSRFPHLTTKQIRNNAMIEDGLARAANDTDARNWLAHFGSAQRGIDELESSEAQALVFSGLPRHQVATMLALRLPESSEAAQEIIRALVRFKRESGDRKLDGELLATVRFGDIHIEGPALALGLTASGLARLGLREGRGLDQLPAAFRMGMHGRHRILGDYDADGASKAPHWRWSDDAEAGNGVDAVIIVYSDERASHDRLVESHRRQLAALGAHIAHEIPCSPPRDKEGREDLHKEHFGFRDGISQPVIRGSRKVVDRPALRDIVSAGEFLMGYRNDQGYVSPSVAIGAEQDPGSLLPTVAEYDPNRFPYYGNHSSQPDLRDFGRNSSFLVLRQLDQDVDGFHQGMAVAASKLVRDKNGYAHLEKRLGHKVDAQWVAAKIIGRWQNGAPLIGNTNCPAQLDNYDHPDNDFAYGVDDPRGMACPLGSHIRRTNPRDSLEPGDPDEQSITNRHRIIRRGRTYSYCPPGSKTEVKGLLFAAICSDLERQFEFVQHTWVNASTFHGLTDEADPLIGNPRAPDGQFIGQGNMRDGRDARFTIPTAVGPVVVEGLKSYVEMKAGGYFLLPSRSALLYLSRLK